MEKQKCLAVIAAVSSKRGLIAFHSQPNSINSKTFVTFLEQLRKITNQRRLLILLDNCSINKTRAAMMRAEQLGMELLFNVPYSPWFNGIELVWALAKQKFRKLLLKQITGQAPTESFSITIEKVMTNLDPDQIKRCCLSALRLIENTV